MDLTDKSHFTIQRSSITIAIVAIVMLVFISSCSGRKKQLGEAIYEKDSLPTVTTLGVESLISDSGVIRYKLEAEEWIVYQKRNPPFWAFEKGIYIEKFDSLMQVDAYIEADTAYYYERKKLWELRKNVLIRNLEGDQIETDLLFWDQNTEKVYSNQYTKILQEDKTIIGNYGFESNQQLTKYFIYNSEGVFTIDEEAQNDSIKTESIQNDSIKTDSIK